MFQWVVSPLDYSKSAVDMLSDEFLWTPCPPSVISPLLYSLRWPRNGWTIVTSENASWLHVVSWRPVSERRRFQHWTWSSLNEANYPNEVFTVDLPAESKCCGMCIQIIKSYIPQHNSTDLGEVFSWWNGMLEWSRIVECWNTGIVDWLPTWRTLRWWLL